MADDRKAKPPQPQSGTSTKDPEQDAEHPASMPCDQQGSGRTSERSGGPFARPDGGTPPQNDPAGQQGGYHESPSKLG